MGGMRITLALIVGLLLARPARAEPDSFGLGTGRDGPLTIVAGNGVVLGSAFPLTQAASKGAAELTVPGLLVADGDLVMIHDSLGLTPLPEPGNAKPVDLAAFALGRFELARLASVDQSTGLLKLTQPLRYAYPASRTQVLRVPEYTDVVVEAGARLSVVPWSGKAGGILAMLVAGMKRNSCLTSGMT